jgi:hypothetical protein
MTIIGESSERDVRILVVVVVAATTRVQKEI